MRLPLFFGRLSVVASFLFNGIFSVAEEGQPPAGEPGRETVSLEHGQKLIEQGEFAKAAKEFEQLVQIDGEKYGPQDTKTLQDRAFSN